MGRKTLVLVVFLVLTCSWGSGTQASQIGLDFNVSLSPYNPYIWGGLSRIYYTYNPDLPLGGSLVGSPSGPGLFSQQATIDVGLQIYTNNRLSGGTGYLQWPDRPDSILVQTLLRFQITSSLDQTEPLPFTEAHWSLSYLKQDRTLQRLYDFQGLVTGERTVSSGYGDDPVPIEVLVPVSWTFVFHHPDYGDQWYGEGEITSIPFVISLEGYVGPKPEPGQVPVPGSLVLFSSGLLGLAGWRLKFRRF